jgi:hypothetical protein
MFDVQLQALNGLEQTAPHQVTTRMFSTGDALATSPAPFDHSICNAQAPRPVHDGPKHGIMHEA